MFDQIDAMVRQANPEPDLSMLNADDIPVPLFNEQGSTGMQTDTTPDVPEIHKGPRRGRGVAAVAAVVVLLLGGILFLRSGSDPVAGTEEVAVSFAQARATNNADAVVALMSEDAVVDMGPASSVAEIPAEMAWQQASGLTFTFERCDFTGLTASCVVSFDSAVATANGKETDAFVYDIVIADGLIVSAMLSDIGNYETTTWDPFHRWAISTSVDGSVIMYDGGISPVITEESINLWRSNTARYVAEHS